MRCCEPFLPVGHLLRHNHPGIQTDGVQSPEEASMLNLHAAILDKSESGLLRFLPGCIIHDAQLEPENLSADFNGLLGNWQNILGFAKDIDDFNTFARGFRLSQRRVNAFAKEGFARVAWINRHDVIAFSLEVNSNKMAGAIGI